jgi:integrase
MLVALKAGLRQGELIGLQWGDVDLQRGKLHVRRTIWRGVSGLPKGGRERTVELPGSAVDALKVLPSTLDEGKAGQNERAG